MIIIIIMIMIIITILYYIIIAIRDRVPQCTLFKRINCCCS